MSFQEKDELPSLSVRFFSYCELEKLGSSDIPESSIGKTVELITHLSLFTESLLCPFVPSCELNSWETGVFFWQSHMAIEGVPKIFWVLSHPNRLLSITAPQPHPEFRVGKEKWSFLKIQLQSENGE